MSDWQPIETAPKGGTSIMLAVDDDVGPGYYRKRNSDYPGHCWHWLDGDGECNPSMWQPYPPPPKRQTEKKAKEEITKTLMEVLEALVQNRFNPWFAQLDHKPGVYEGFINGYLLGVLDGRNNPEAPANTRDLLP